MALSPAQQQSRLAFDYEVVRSMLPAEILEVESYASLVAMEHRNQATEAEGRAGRVPFYLVRYKFATLVGPDKTATETTVLFDISSAIYPFEEPGARVLSRPLPWTPHVHPTAGVICQGENFRNSRGHALLAHAIIHVAHILNFDEFDRGEGYSGYNPPAAQYWRKSMKRAPVNPGLAYPNPSVEVTHGISVPPAFRILDEDNPSEGCFCLVDEVPQFRLMETT